MSSSAACDGLITNVKVTYQWEIPNFCTTCPKDKKTLMSPILIYQKSLKFQMLVYPQGRDEKCNEYVSLFLSSLNKATVNVTFEFSILNRVGKKLYYHSTRHEFKPESIGHGWANYVKQDDIMNNRAKFLSENKLRIVCKITVHNVIDHPDKDSDVQVNKRPRLDMGVQSNGYDFEQFFNSKEFSDVTLLSSDSKRIPAHKFILASKSKVFLSMFQNASRQNTFQIKGINSEVLEEMLLFVYTNRVNNLSKNAQELLVYAEKYELNDLKLLCEKTLCDSISNTNALELITYAESHKLPMLRKQTINYIVSNMKEVVNTPNFKSTAVRFPDICVEILTLCAAKN